MFIDTTGEINFFSHTKDGCFPWIDGSPKLGWSYSNYVQIPTKVKIYDLRDQKLNIDINGFELINYYGNIHQLFQDNTQQQFIYYQDIINILKNHLNASRVLPFGHVIRFRGPERPSDQCDNTHKNPVFYPHVDNDSSSAHLKLKEVLGEEEAEKLIKKRFQIINVWKPLGPNPIINTPLTICDYQTLDINYDIHTSYVKGSESTVSIYVISKNKINKQKWYYCSYMKSNEMFVFKIFDSKSNVAQFGAHTAFTNHSVPSNNLQQCSIEMRCLVIYDQ